MPRTPARLAALLVAGYGNVIASVIAASFGVRGLALEPPPSGVLVFLLFTAAIVATTLVPPGGAC